MYEFPGETCFQKKLKNLFQPISKSLNVIVSLLFFYRKAVHMGDHFITFPMVFHRRHGKLDMQENMEYTSDQLISLQDVTDTFPK